MRPGRLIAVVGPSGAGKDSVMDGIAQRLPAVRRIRRVITRDAACGGEEFSAVSSDCFGQMVRQGAFCLHWDAHGLRYGIPVDALDTLAGGTACLVNLSRGVLMQAQACVPQFVVLNITASPAVLAARLAARGRETDEGIAHRLDRATKPLPQGLTFVTLCNDGALADTVNAAITWLYPVRA